MLEFLHSFVSWLNFYNVMPAEKREGPDTDVDCTYLMQLPDSPDDVHFIQEYNSNGDPLIAHDTCVRYIQIIVRKRNQQECYDDIEKIHKFLKDRPDYIDDLPNGIYMIIACNKDPVKLDNDAQGRILYSLSFAITTNS